jgi:hypothetical protein
VDRPGDVGGQAEERAVDGDDPLEQRLELRVLLGEVRQAGP